jgi:hypothetical protein
VMVGRRPIRPVEPLLGELHHPFLLVQNRVTELLVRDLGRQNAIESQPFLDEVIGGVEIGVDATSASPSRMARDLPSTNSTTGLAATRLFQDISGFSPRSRVSDATSARETLPRDPAFRGPVIPGTPRSIRNGTRITSRFDERTRFGLPRRGSGR